MEKRESNYQSVVRALREMHRLSTLGLFESPEAEKIRDAMDEPWRALTDAEQESLRRLSEGLNTGNETITNEEMILQLRVDHD